MSATPLTVLYELFSNFACVFLIICMWIGHSGWINFCHFFGIVNIVIFHPEYIDSGCLL